MKLSRWSGLLRAGAVLVALGLLAGCDRTATLKGVLRLKPGETGDVRGSRVVLYVSTDSTPVAVFETESDAAGDMFRSSFAFFELDEGVYHVVAWKDVDQDGSISDGDLVGVPGGEYDSTYMGEQVGVIGGQENDVGVIEMQPYLLLTVSASGSRDYALMSTSFGYSFNSDVVLVSLTIDFPGFGVYQDPVAPGAKTAGVLYRSDDWSFGSEMPQGQHVLVFRGYWNGKWFQVDVPVLVE